MIISIGEGEIVQTIKMKVEFFGQFKIIVNEQYYLDDTIIHSNRMSRLLAYMIYHHDKKITSIELQDIMFDENSSNNPANALKSLIHRVRSLLKKHFGDIEIIKSGKGLYYFNDEISLETDVEQFKQYIERARHFGDDFQKVATYKKGIEIYKGPFLPMIANQQWVMIENTYLESIYMTTVVYLLKKYKSFQKYEEVEKISEKAIQFDQLNESLHYYLIDSLINQNKIQLAKKHYQNAEKILYNELGIHPNPELQNLYQEIQLRQRIKEDNINDIQKKLIEENIIGAFQCSFETFKKIYQLDVRKAMRSKGSEYLVLLTIHPRSHIHKDSDIYEAVIESTATLLNQVLLTSLRVGDTFTKYSHCQYLLLLPDCTDENVMTVIHRILKNFYKADRYKRVDISYKLDEIQLFGGRLV